MQFNDKINFFDIIWFKRFYFLLKMVNQCHLIHFSYNKLGILDSIFVRKSDLELRLKHTLLWARIDDSLKNKLKKGQCKLKSFRWFRYFSSPNNCFLHHSTRFRWHLKTLKKKVGGRSRPLKIASYDPTLKVQILDFSFSLYKIDPP